MTVIKFSNNCLHSIFSVILSFKLVELANVPALICRRCEKYVSQAAELRRTIMKSDEYYRGALTEERYMWHENLRELKPALKAAQPEKAAQIPQATLQTSEVDDTADDDVIFTIDLDSEDLEKFMTEADEVLTQSLDDIEASEPAKIKEEKEDSESLYAETEINYDSDAELDLSLLTNDQIQSMTDQISRLLPKLNETKDKKSSKKKVKLQKRLAKRKHRIASNPPTTRNKSKTAKRLVRSRNSS